MEWVDGLTGAKVALDTAPLIYYIKEHPAYGPLVDPFFDALSQGLLTAVTSAATLLEVLVHPLRQSDEKLAQDYNDILLRSANLKTLPITFATAQTAAELRAQFNLKTPDAIQVATALRQQADALLTNDRDIAGIPGIRVINLKELLAT
jgi:predicted nucleic acid-binding protein